MATTSANTNHFIPRINFPSLRPITKNDLSLLGPNGTHIESNRGLAHAYSKRAFQTAQRRSEIATMAELVNNISDTESWHVQQVKQLSQILGDMQRSVTTARIETNDCERKIVRLERGLQLPDRESSRFVAGLREAAWKGMAKQRRRDEEEIVKLRRQMKEVQEKLLEMDATYEDQRREIWDAIEHRW